MISVFTALIIALVTLTTGIATGLIIPRVLRKADWKNIKVSGDKGGVVFSLELLDEKTAGLVNLRLSKKPVVHLSFDPKTNVLTYTSPTTKTMKEVIEKLEEIMK